MASKGVIVVVSGEDKTGEVFNSIKKHMDETKSKAKETSESLSGIGKTLEKGLAAAGIAIGAREIANGLKEMVSSTIEAGVHLGHLAQQTGISVQNLSVLKYAAQSTGVDFDTLTKGFKKLAVTTIDADHGVKTAAKGFNMAGISVEQLRAKGDDMYGVLTLLADKFHAMPDGMIKSDAAAKIFGARMGSEMIPILNELGGKLDSVKEEAQALGIVWDEAGIKKMEALHHSAAQLEGAMQGLALELTNDLGSSLISVGKELANDIKLFAEFLGLGKKAGDITIGHWSAANAALQQPNMKNDPNAEYWKQLQLYKAQTNAKLFQDEAQTAHGYPANWNRQKIDAHRNEVESLKAQAARLDSEIDRVALQILADQKKLEPKTNTAPLGGGGDEGGSGGAASARELTQIEASLQAPRSALLDLARAWDAERIANIAAKKEWEDQKSKDALDAWMGSVDFKGGRGVFPTAQAPNVKLARWTTDDAAEAKGEAEKYAHGIFDPLFDLSGKWDQQWKKIKANLLRDFGQTMESQLFGSLFGDASGQGGKGMDGSGGKPKGHNGLLGDGLRSLGGLLHHKSADKTSNGGLGSGAGTIPDPTASLMQMGSGAAKGGGGIQVVINNTGTPQTATATQQSGGTGVDHEKIVLHVFTKDMDTGGPISMGIKGMMGLC